MLDIAQLEEEIKEEQQNSDKQPKTMNELRILVSLRGEQWRNDPEHQYEDRKTKGMKAHKPIPAQTAGTFETMFIRAYWKR